MAVKTTPKPRAYRPGPGDPPACLACEGTKVTETPAGPLTVRPGLTLCVHCAGTGREPASRTASGPGPRWPRYPPTDAAELILEEARSIGASLKEISQRRRPQYVRIRESLYDRVRDLSRQAGPANIRRDEFCEALGMSRQALHIIENPEMYRKPKR